MRRNAALLAALAVLVAALGGTAAESAPNAKKSPRLKAFGTCGQLLGYAKGHASRFVSPYGLGIAGGPGFATTGAERATAPAAGADLKAGVDFSGTNVQEEGVDEPDMVKTDGKTLFAIGSGKLNAVDVSGAKPQLLDSLKLENGGGELLLHGDKLLVLSNGGYWIQPLPGLARSIAPWQPAKSVLAEIDVSDPKKLRLVRTLELDGSYVARAARRRHRSHRRRGAGTERAALRAAGEPVAGGAGRREEAQQRHRRLVARHQLAAVLPDQARRREAGQGAPARPVPPRQQAARVLRLRDADGADASTWPRGSSRSTRPR